MLHVENERTYNNCNCEFVCTIFENAGNFDNSLYNISVERALLLVYVTCVIPLLL